MDGTASARLWKKYKAILIGLCEASGRPFAEKSDAEKTTTEAAE